MDLTHRFSVPVGVTQAWDHFNDIASVAECFPGAQVSSVDGGTFSGSVKVKLGPIALVYNGSGTFVEKDEDAHRFVVDAKGKDKRGNGTAGAKVTVTMIGDGSGTEVEVVTDLAITGKPAQFGRGVMQDVSDKLLGQFVTCLEERLTATDDGPGVDPAADPDPRPSAGDGSQEATPETPPSPDGPQAPRAAAGSVPPAPPGDAPPASATQVGGRAAPGEDDSLDLGAAVLPVLAKAYWKQALIGLLALALVWRVLRR